MRAFVQGVEINPNTAFFVPSMLLGSYHPRGQASTCQLEVSEVELLGLLNAPYEQLVQELKRDDSITGETDFLGYAGYPPLESILTEPKLLLELFDTYLASDFFAIASERYGWDASSGYFISRFTSVEFGDGLVVIQAECLPHGLLNQPVA
jgi:hypothetical protein